MDGYVTIGTKIDTSGIDTGLSKINKSVTQGMNGLQNTISKTFNLIKNSIIGAGIILALRVITKELGNAVTRLDTMKNYVNVMSNLGIGSKEAQASIERLSEKLKGLPTTLDSAALAVQKFTSVNRNLKASTEMFLAVNNAILAGGASAQQQATALYQLSDAYAKGKPDMMDWRSMMTAMPAQLTQVANVMGYMSANDLGEALRKGTVSMNDFMITLVKMNRQGLNGFKSLEEQAKNSTGGIQTSIENVKTAITRGLANIMDAIGRSNIAGFFDGIRNAIDKVIPYIQAFVKLIVTAVSYIASLFGRKPKTEIQKETESMSSFGAAVGDTAEELNGASGSAGKLYKELKQLAGFDEMNVLSENKSSGGGSGGGGGSAGGGADMTAIDFDFGEYDKVSSKMDEIYEKMKKWALWFTEDMDFKPLVKSIKNLSEAMDHLKAGLGDWMERFVEHFIKPLATYTVNKALPRFLNAIAKAHKQIDWDKINDAFEKLWDALEPFVENIGDGLLWLYENVLVPVSVWANNNVLPVVLETIAGILKIINKLIDDLKPVLEPIWNNIIKPLGEIIGQAIVDVLTTIRDIINWIAENAGALGFLEGIGPKIEDIKKFLGELFNKIKEVWNNTKQILSDLLQYLYDKFIKPIQEFFNGFWQGLKLGFDIVINTIKTMWDNFKQYIVDTVTNTWNGVVAIISTIANWVNKNIIQPVSNFFTSLWDGIKTGVKSAVDFVKSIFNSVINFFKNLISTIVGLFKNIGTKVGDAIGGAFRGVINSVIGAVEGILNSPIRAINGLIDVIKKIPGLGKLGKLSTFRFARLATGAIINQPGRGVPVGGAIAGEAGREGILPLTDDRAMAQLGREIGRWITINANIPVSIGNRQIAREVRQLMAQDDFAMNN